MWQFYSRSLYPEKYLGLDLKTSHCHPRFPILGLIFSLGKQVGKKVFLTSGEKMTFDQVKALCAQFQGSMATPLNEEENKAIQNVAPEGAFLGITDTQTEGHFVDLTGRAVTYQNWNNNEPNDAGPGEDCVIILTEGTWNDVTCSYSSLAVCEFPV